KLSQIAKDLGIVRGTLRQWLETHGARKKTAVGGTLTDSPLRSAPIVPTSDPDELLERRVARLDAENYQLRAETTKLATNREILQTVAKHSAGETRWSVASNSSPRSPPPTR